MLVCPIRSKNPPESIPVATYLLIVANIVFFFASWGGSMFMHRIFIERYGLAWEGIQAYKFFTSMFVHGDIFHLAFNMLFLFVFGSSVEGRLRTGKFVLLYFSGGIAGSLLHLLTIGRLEPSIPVIGASGAIYGTIGAALYMFPYGRVTVFFLLIIFLRFFEWPMWAVVFMFTLLDMVGVLRSVAMGEPGGVANLAHLGGVAAGFAMCLLVRPPRDAKFVSAAKATLSDTKDLETLTEAELAGLVKVNPGNAHLAYNWAKRAIRDQRPQAFDREEFFRHIDFYISEYNPKEVAWVLTSIMPEPRLFASHLAQVALRLEQTGDPLSALRVQDVILRMPGLGDRDREAALFRWAYLQETAVKNRELASQGYRRLIEDYPMNPMADQAKSRLDSL